MQATNPSLDVSLDVRSGDVAMVSFVVPVFNEQDSIADLVQQISQVCQRSDIRHEVVLIDDGSTDESWKVIQAACAECDEVSGIRFRRNFGKADALQAGIQASVGKIVITMDADLQDDPAEVPRFLESMNQGLDLVSGWKKVRHDPWHKLMPSLAFNKLVSWLTGVKLHDHNCGFKAYRREIFDEVTLYGERHRFVPVLAAAKGWKVGEIEVKHHARKFGHSKYGVSRLVKGFLDLMTVHLLTGYSSRPFHLIGSIGLLCFAAGGLGIVYLSVIRLLSHWSDSMVNVHLHQTAVFYYCILAVLLGAQFLTTGLLAELIVSRTTTQGSAFSVAEKVGRLASDEGDHSA